MKCRRSQAPARPSTCHNFASAPRGSAWTLTGFTSNLRSFVAPLVGLAATLGVLATLAGCRPGGVAGRVPAGHPVILISVDTLRSDRLPAYGYDRVETPAIDGLRADGILFQHAYSEIPLTLPSHATIMTGLLPPETGVRDNAGYRLEADAGPTLGELLGQQGYATGAAISAYPLRAETGISRGFDFYDDDIPEAKRMLMGGLQRPGEDTLRAALGWLDSLPDGDGGQGDGKGFFFLFFHIYEPHTPRDPPEPFASRYADPYDGEVAAADAVVGHLLDALRERGLYDGSTIVFLSDHGEGLDDHGEDEHGLLLYRESLQVPLMIKLPGALDAGATVPYTTALVDIMPTVLQVAGVEPPDGLAGVSLLRLLGDDVPPELTDRPAYSETFHPQLRFGWSGLRSIIQSGHHYIEGVDRELYDLQADPAEQHDVLREDRRTYAALRDQLAKIDSDLEAPFEEDEETQQALASLGYLGSSTAEQTGPLPDPKKMIVKLRPLREGISLLHEKRTEEAIPRLEEATEAIPESLDAWQFLGLANQEAGHPKEALAAYERAFELSNGAPHLAQPMAEMAMRLKRWKDAATYLELAIEQSPKDLRLRFFRTRALLFAGDLDQAAQSAEKTVEVAPENPDALYLLGAVRMGRRDLAGAEKAFRRALAVAPDHPAVLSDLSVLLASQGRRQEAESLLERLVKIQPDNRAARANLQRLRSGS